jgi:hypothetical protein
MGLLDDAIREHLELKRRRGANADEVARQEQEALGPARRAEFVSPEAEEDPSAVPAPPPVPTPDEPPELGDDPVAEEPPAAPPPVPVEEPRDQAPEPEPWLDEPDEVPAQDALEHHGTRDPDVVEADAEPAGEDMLEETPEFLQETPEHDRLWFEQKPPRDFDFDK